LESRRIQWFLNVAYCCAFFFWANYANAQISPDGTLPNNSSVTVNGNTFNITGETQAGSNLFHSFGEFSVPTSIKAFFNNTTGGNITINTGVLAALENSDISANSTDGRGGNIYISTQGLFGIQFRPQQTFLSDITATRRTSELQGTVQINKGIDPTRGLTQLPSTPTNSSNQIIAGCPASEDARFTVTGRGDLPENPRATLLSQVVLQDFRPSASASVVSKRDNELGIKNNLLTIVEAQSWVVKKQGDIELVANTPHHKRSLGNDQINCQK
jgi:large exoprotein involved in heme utilization and adhesion